MDLQVKKLQNELTESTLRKDISRAVATEVYTNKNLSSQEKAIITGTSGGVRSTNLSDEQFNRLREAAQIESEYNEEVKKIAQELVNSNELSKYATGIWINSMGNYRESLNEYTQSIEDNAIAIKNSNKLIASSVLGPGANNIQTALFEDQYQKAYDAEYEKQLKFINDNVKRSDERLSKDVIDRINKTTGGNYSEAQEHSNQVIGNDGDRGIWVYDKSQQKDVMYTNEE